jgi:hypothetical protein
MLTPRQIMQTIAKWDLDKEIEVLIQNNPEGDDPEKVIIFMQDGDTLRVN